MDPADIIKMMEVTEGATNHTALINDGLLAIVAKYAVDALRSQTSQKLASVVERKAHVTPGRFQWDFWKHGTQVWVCLAESFFVTLVPSLLTAVNTKQAVLNAAVAAFAAKGLHDAHILPSPVKKRKVFDANATPAN